MLLVVNYLLVKPVDVLMIDSILSMIDLTRVNSKSVEQCAKAYHSTMYWHFTARVTLSIKCVGI